METPDVICEKRGSAGLIRLNRPKALNALTLPMVHAIAQALDAWEHDPDVTRIVLDAEGEKAFCAGGDIRSFTASEFGASSTTGIIVAR